MTNRIQNVYISTAPDNNMRFILGLVIFTNLTEKINLDNNFHI